MKRPSVTLLFHTSYPAPSVCLPALPRPLCVFVCPHLPPLEVAKVVVVPQVSPPTPTANLRHRTTWLLRSISTSQVGLRCSCTWYYLTGSNHFIIINIVIIQTGSRYVSDYDHMMWIYFAVPHVQKEMALKEGEEKHQRPESGSEFCSRSVEIGSVFHRDKGN